MNESAGGKLVIQIGDFAQRAGVSVRAVRYYEELGLIRPETHTVGGFRLYSEDSLKRLQVINCLKEMGLSLAEIRRIFLAKKPGAGNRQAVEFLLSAFLDKLKHVESKIGALIRTKEELANAVRILRSCRSCDRDVLLDKALCGDCASMTPRDAIPCTLEVIMS